jgi:hypothetical protein
MLCPQCSHAGHRAAVTNSHPTDQIVRKRVCEACGYVWFTVELVVPSYAVGWSVAHKRKPVLRAPVELKAAHIEAKDQLAGLREQAARRAKEAEERYGM